MVGPSRLEKERHLHVITVAASMEQTLIVALHLVNQYCMGAYTK